MTEQATGQAADDRETIEAYNYASFTGRDDFVAFRSVLPVGSSAPDFDAFLLQEGRTAKLSDYWRERDVLIEFGSLT